MTNVTAAVTQLMDTLGSVADTVTGSTVLSLGVAGSMIFMAIRYWKSLTSSGGGRRR